MSRFSLLLLLCLPLGLSAQSDFTTTTALFGDLRARQIGPAVMSGRVSCLEVHPTDPATVFVGAGGGGVWRTTNGGGTLRPVFDDHTQSIGDIAIAPSNPKVIYVGTGEAWPRNSVSVGTGMYRSSDNGDKWTAIGLEDSERIADIAVHPEDENTLYVAALGHLWDANEQRGVFKSTDGGRTWTKCLYLDEDTGAASIAMDPTNPDVLYAAMWSFRRRPHTFDSGFGGTSGLYKTTDGGANWTELTNGLPDETLGRIGVDVSPADPSVLYASVETGTEATKGMYRSTDGGESWTPTGRHRENAIRPFYFSKVIAAPHDTNTVAKCGYVGIISENGGQTWRAMDPNAHADWHDIWFDPGNPKHMLAATDGGVYESMDGGRTYKMWMNLPVSQFYRVSVDSAAPYRVYGGLQDNGSWYATAGGSGSISNSAWKKTFGGDGFYSFRHPTKEHFVFSEYQGGKLVRYDERTGRAKTLTPYAREGEDELRWNWNSPLLVSRDGRRLYFGAQYLYRSTDDGDSWQRISPDLTTNRKEWQQQQTSGGLTIDNSTAENHTTLYAIAESPRDPSILWVGTDDGNLHVSRNAGKDWTQVNANLPDLPPHTWVTFIEASPHNAATAFVTLDGHRRGDKTPYLYRTTDGGSTWTNLATDDVKGYALSVRQDPINPDLLFLGTEFGLYISLDGGNSWAPFRNNLPQVGIRDMVIQEQESDLVMGTHGRGIIILDDLEALRQITPEIAGEKLVFLNTEPAYLGNRGGFGVGDFSGSGTFVGPGKSSDARIMYYAAKRHLFGKMDVEILKDGELIRTIPAGKSAGINIVTLPLSMPKPKAAPTNNRMALFGTLSGPTLPSGTYQVRLNKGKETYETEVNVGVREDDVYTAADRNRQREVLMQTYDMSETVGYVYDVLDRIDKQATALEVPQKKLIEQARALAETAKTMKNDLVFLGGDGYVNEGSNLREEIGELYFAISSFPGIPGQSQVREAERLQREVTAVQQRFQRFLDGPVADLNDRLEAERRLTWLTKEAYLAEEEEAGTDTPRQDFLLPRY